MAKGQRAKGERAKNLKIFKELRIRKKEKAKSTMLGFTKYTKGDYDAQWFHKLMCKYLDKLEKGEIKKLMIFIPPQHGKSELSSRRFPAYALGKNPKTKIAVCSYSKGLSSGFGRDCQNIIDTPEYKELFPETYLNGNGVTDANGEARNNSFFETVGHRGFLKAVGLRSGLTGTPVDIGIIDDPFSGREQANSKLIRDRAWMWYQDVFLERLHNDSKQLMLFTRWHEDDIAGRILDPQNEHYNAEEAAEWTVIAIPALKEEEKPIEQAIHVSDPREIDEALWESKHSAKKYKLKRKITPSSFSSLHQQRPTAADGNKIKKEWLQIIKEGELPFSTANIAADFFIDGAFTDKTKNDQTGLLSAYYHKQTGNMYIFNASGVRKELYELLKYFRPYAKSNEYGVNSSVYIELKASGYPLKSMLSKVDYGGFNTRKIDPKVEALGKFNRVENSEPFLASGKVFLVEGSWNKAFIAQCTAFPNGAHDDMVDVLTYAVHRYFIKKSAAGVDYVYGV